MYKTCCFFGHRDAKLSQDELSELRSVVSDLIEKKGVRRFLFGGFGEFDEVCHLIVSDFVGVVSGVERIYCLEDRRYLMPYKRPPYLKEEDYEEFVYLDVRFESWYQRIYYRNLEMIDISDFCIFYVEKKQNSGAEKALRYAKTQKKDILNIAKEQSLGG